MQKRKYKPTGAEVCSSLSRGMVVGAVPLFLMALFLFIYYCVMLGGDIEDKRSALIGLTAIFAFPAGINVLMNIAGLALAFFGKKADAKGFKDNWIINTVLLVASVIMFVIILCTVNIGGGESAVAALSAWI